MYEIHSLEAICRSWVHSKGSTKVVVHHCCNGLLNRPKKHSQSRFVMSLLKKKDQLAKSICNINQNNHMTQLNFKEKTERLTAEHCAHMENNFTVSRREVRCNCFTRKTATISWMSLSNLHQPTEPRHKRIKWFRAGTVGQDYIFILKLS